MENQDLLNILGQGVEAWNKWRVQNPEIEPDLSKAKLLGAILDGADLSRADLTEANLTHAFLHEANLSHAILTGATLIGTNFCKAHLCHAKLNGADLHRANLDRSDLTGANLSDANLERAILVGAIVSDAIFTRCRVYGASAWDLVNLEKVKDQSNLQITREGDPVITVDNLEVAPFVYLLLPSKGKISTAINTITSKAILILGRFTPERKVVLDALRKELSTLDCLPIIFDFDTPTDRDFTETILTLAGMSKFIIADLTQPRSSPLESYVTITNYRVPFIPIIQEGEWPFAMFDDLQRNHHWVLRPLKYKDKDDLIRWVGKIVDKANAKYEEIQIEKINSVDKPVSGDEW